MEKSTKKPCIQCEKECEILPVMLADTFTLTYLRVCSPECMFFVVYDFLYEIGYHRDFRNKLYDKQNDEDKALRDEFIDTTQKLFFENFKKNLEANPNLLGMPAPEGLLKMFADAPALPVCGGTMRFPRISKSDKIKYATQHVERCKKDLREAIEDLEKLQHD